MSHYTKLLFVFAIFATLLVAPATGEEKVTSEEKKPAYKPTEDYLRLHYHGWKIFLDPDLPEKKPEIYKETMRVLHRKLDEINTLVPSGSVKKIQTLPIWVEHSSDKTLCMCYHVSREWLKENGFNPDKAKSVELSNPETFLDWIKLQPTMVLHEYAHGYHDVFLGGYDNPEIAKCYEAAVKSKKYEKVFHSQGGHRRAYALNNSQEYFAEATEALFGRNDFYPFCKPELMKHDPELFKVLQECWNRYQTKEEIELQKKLAAERAAEYKRFAGNHRGAHRDGEKCTAFLPTMEYYKENYRGWLLYVHPAYYEPHGEDNASLRMAKQKLDEIIFLLPKTAVDKLRKVPIWFDFGDHPRAGGACFHPSRGWLVSNKFNPDKTDCVEFGKLIGLPESTRRQPMVMLHELAHGYHDTAFPGGYGSSQFREIYKNAMDKGLYQKVLFYSGKEVKAYGATNDKEYFAELSEAYFGLNDFYPFNRAELKEYDPEGYKFIEKAWGK